MLRTVKENPVPSAIVALGLALLFKARKDKSAEDRYSRRDWSPNTSGEASGIRQKTEEVAGNLKGKAHEIAGAAGEKVQQAAHQVSEKARRTGTSLQGFFESNPIIAGAGVLVLGAAIGALIPETEKEKRLMGHTRDEIVDKTKSVVQQAQGTIEQKMSEHSGNPSAGWGSGQQSK